MVEGAVFRGKAELLPKLVVRLLYSHLCSKKQKKTVSWVVSSSWVHFVLIDNMIYLRWWWVTVLAWSIIIGSSSVVGSSVDLIR